MPEKEDSNITMQLENPTIIKGKQMRGRQQRLS